MMFSPLSPSCCLILSSKKTNSIRSLMTMDWSCRLSMNLGASQRRHGCRFVSVVLLSFFCFTSSSLGRRRSAAEAFPLQRHITLASGERIYRSHRPLFLERPSSSRNGQRQQQQQQQPASKKQRQPAAKAKRRPSSSPSNKNSNKIEASLRTQLDFARNGHCVLRRAFSRERILQLNRDLSAYGRKQELMAWQQKVEVAAKSVERAQACSTVAACRKTLVEFAVSPDEVPFLQYFNTWRELPAVQEVARDLAATAASLLDCDSIRLYQDSLFWKRAEDGPTPWHTDGRMAPFDTSLLLTFWIPLHDISREDGSGLIFCNKSHCDFALPYWNEHSQTKEDPDSPWNHLDERYGGNAALVDYMPLAAGDLTAHHGWTLHCADPPGSPKGRVALAISYVDARAVVRHRNSNTKDAGNPEDTWSYRDWIREVPKNHPNFVHPLVPILYSSKNGSCLPTIKGDATTSRGRPKKP
jgi:ectoine hydroxylase-related dioxygenase (phytanoyl-CoA dioxygenase family)